MAGISSVISKFSCPMYYTSASSTACRTTSNNMHMIPLRSCSSSLHLENITPILATTHLLKHRVYSSSTSKSVSCGFNGNKVKELGVGEKAKRAFCALEMPVLYAITFMAFTKIVVLVAPTMVASQYITSARWGAIMLSFLLFLHRWKTNVSTHSGVINRAKLSTLDKICIVGLFFYGGMHLAVTCGVDVQSVLAVGGVATAFATRHIIGNILSGEILQNLQVFSIGERVDVGSVGGHVLDVGLTTTALLTADMFVMVVPNLLFFSEGFFDKPWAGWHHMVVKINVQFDEFEKIPEILEEIKKMMRCNSNVFMESEQPYCYVSQVERSFAELTLGCNLKMTSRDMLYSAEEDVRQQSFKIIQKHGATFVGTWGT